MSSEQRTCRICESKLPKLEVDFKIEAEGILGFLIAQNTPMHLNVNCSGMGMMLGGLNSFWTPWWQGKHNQLLAISKASIN